MLTVEQQWDFEQWGATIAEFVMGCLEQVGVNRGIALGVIRAQLLTEFPSQQRDTVPEGDEYAKVERGMPVGLAHEIATHLVRLNVDEDGNVYNPALYPFTKQ